MNKKEMMTHVTSIWLASLMTVAIQGAVFALDASSSQHPQYWLNILGKRDPAEEAERRNPSSALMRKTWVDITAMPAEDAWIIMTQIQRPEKADLYPVEEVLQWAQKSVSPEHILDLMHKKKDHLVYNNWLFARWAYFYVSKHGDVEEKTYLRKLIDEYNHANPLRLDENVYLALHSLMEEPDANRFLMDAFKADHVSLERIFETYGVDGLCTAVTLIDNPRLHNSWFKGIDQYHVFAPLLDVLTPPTDESKAAGRWHTIYVILRKLERFAGNHLSETPQGLNTIGTYSDCPAGADRRPPSLHNSQLWERSVGKRHDCSVYSTAKLKVLREEWLKIIKLESKQGKHNNVLENIGSNAPNPQD